MSLIWKTRSAEQFLRRHFWWNSKNLHFVRWLLFKYQLSLMIKTIIFHFTSNDNFSSSNLKNSIWAINSNRLKLKTKNGQLIIKLSRRTTNLSFHGHCVPKVIQTSTCRKLPGNKIIKSFWCNLSREIRREKPLCDLRLAGNLLWCFLYVYESKHDHCCLSNLVQLY